MPTVLILANETIAGKALLDRIRERSDEGARFFVVVPKVRLKPPSEPKNDDIANLRSSRFFDVRSSP